jgi:hypothetical protein
MSLAHQFGFDADTVWNDPKNAQLQQLRKDPNILLAGDVLYIPDQNGPPVMQSLTTGTTNTFVAPVPPTMTLTHKFVGADPTTYSSKAYTVLELDPLTGLESDENGIVTFQAPVTLNTATVVFTDTGESWALCIGAMDPINTISGIFKRLQSLGYIGAGVSYDSNVPANNLGVMRSGLFLLKAAQTSGGDNSAPNSASASNPAPSSTSNPTAAPESGPASTPAPDSTPASDPAPSSGSLGPSGGCSASPASDPAPSSDPASSPPSGPGDSDPAPSSSPASSPPSSPGDNAGLADNGTLDADTEELLRNAYGC